MYQQICYRSSTSLSWQHFTSKWWSCAEKLSWCSPTDELEVAGEQPGCGSPSPACQAVLWVVQSLGGMAALGHRAMLSLHWEQMLSCCSKRAESRTQPCRAPGTSDEMQKEPQEPSTIIFLQDFPLPLQSSKPRCSGGVQMSHRGPI